ncbi:MAG: type II toxin-antitoxin system RelE/ParE family toxin [Firmicutes bacterium]|nr:type II toxin-antitoxin system RelE/ParE family toxin [Bacillota bacterium]
MEVQVSPSAMKYLRRMPQPEKGRIEKALNALAEEPPRGDIRTLEGKDGYRMRVGGYRVLFDVVEKKIVVHSIAPRGQAYKGGF